MGFWYEPAKLAEAFVASFTMFPLVMSKVWPPRVAWPVGTVA